MKSRPPKQIVQEIENEDEDNNSPVEIKDTGANNISSAKKSTFIIIAASIILIGFTYYIFLSGIKPEQPVMVVPDIAVKPEEIEAQPGAPIAPPAEENSIFDLTEVDKKEKIENLELMEKQIKPEIPDIPELPSEVKIDEPINFKEANKENSPLNANGDATKDLSPEELAKKQEEDILIAKSSEEIKILDNKIKELEQKLQEQNEKAEKEKLDLAENYKKKEEEFLAKQELDKKTKEIEEKKAEEENEALFGPRYSPILVFSERTGGSPANSVGQDKNIISIGETLGQKIKKTESAVEIEMIEDRTRTIAQGKMINAILETAINTEFPGDVRGIITRDVYGEAGKEILIPKGSRIYGSYSSEVKRGQGRVNISWSRLLRPDGISINIALTASDQFGRAGIPGDLDTKFSSLIANSLLSSVLAVAGTATAQAILGGNTQTSTTVNATQGTTTTIGNAANQALYDVSKIFLDTIGNVVKNTIDTTPVIRIPQGTRMVVMVNSDITIPKLRY
ncbi:MAG: TrbI/VirB10 family protein [Rickettsiales bacterium]